MSILTVKEESLTALGDVIRSKSRTTEPLVFPTGMVEAVNGIEQGLVLTEEQLTFTGNCDYLLANDKWRWLVDSYMDKIKFEDLTDAAYLLANSTYEVWNKDISFASSGSGNGFSYMFKSMPYLKELDIKINGKVLSTNMNNLFSDCYRLRKIGNVFENFDMSYFNTTTGGQQQNWFYNCYSLREIDEHFWDNVVISRNTNYGHLYSSLYQYCYCLDVATLPVNINKECASNCFSDTTFSYCSRVKDILFVTDNDGNPQKAKWKSQVINLAGKYVGYNYESSSYKGYITNYNSGITIDKWVKDDATYQALKNDPDWFTCNYLYSRYNHDSAVNTINSLPDTSAYITANGGTNTIKFSGRAGEYTDGGAINTLTDAEIAVAAAKGWTVSFV